MTQKHTAGPWAVMPSSNPKNGTAWRDIVSLGCEFSPSYVGEAMKYDAALIARAPDLLADNDRLREINAELVAALESVLSTFWGTATKPTPKPNVHESQYALNQARAALNKAKGQS